MPPEGMKSLEMNFNCLSYLNVRYFMPHVHDYSKISNLHNNHGINKEFILCYISLMHGGPHITKKHKSHHIIMVVADNRLRYYAFSLLSD